MKKIPLLCVLSLFVCVSVACTSEPVHSEQPPQTNKEQFMQNMHERVRNTEDEKRAAYLKNIENSQRVSDEEKRDAWRARMKYNAETNTQAEKQESYDRRMREVQSR